MEEQFTYAFTRLQEAKRALRQAKDRAQVSKLDLKACAEEVAEAADVLSRLATKTCRSAETMIDPRVKGGRRG